MNIIVKNKKCIPRVHDNKLYRKIIRIFSINNKNYFSIKYSITYTFDKFITIYLNVIRCK